MKNLRYILNYTIPILTILIRKIQMDIHALRKTRNTDFAKLNSEFEKISNPGSREDDRFWKPEADKAGNATAVIRFLPTAEGDELPFVRIFSHTFKNPANGKWYIENCLSTIGQDDPVNEYNSKLWATGIEANQNIARAQKRQLKFISNILVINDPKNPDNNGKVFLYRYGKKIFDKIMDKAKPTFEDEKPVNVFDLWEGADFKLRMKTVDKFPNYDDSVFATPSELLDGDEQKLLGVVNAQHKLSEFIDPKNFKSYDELKKKLETVLGIGQEPASAPKEEAQPVKEAREVKSAPAPEQKAAPEVTDMEDEDVMSYFNSLNED